MIPLVLHTKHLGCIISILCEEEILQRRTEDEYLRPSFFSDCAITHRSPFHTVISPVKNLFDRRLKTDLRLKYQKQKETSWIQKYAKAKDSIEKQCLMCVLTPSPLKLSNTRTSLHVTRLVSKEDLSKGRPLYC